MVIIISAVIAITLLFYWQHQQSLACTNNAIVFHDNFDRQAIIKEAHPMSESSDQNWWVGSGGYLYLNNGSASTIQGTLPQNDTFRIGYSLSKGSEDTDNGYRPQNIFRMVNRNIWAGNYTAEVYFKY